MFGSEQRQSVSWADETGSSAYDQSMIVTGDLSTVCRLRGFHDRQQRHARCRDRRAVNAVKARGNCATSCCTNCCSAVRFSESSHIFEVSRAKPSHGRKGLEELMSQPVYYLCSPPFRLLTAKNVSGDAQ
jgi:hypothetical protein